MLGRWKDTQLLWIVLLAFAFWVGVWKSELVAHWAHKASLAIQDLRRK